MALSMRVQQVVAEPDGLFSVYVQFYDTADGKVLAKKTVQGGTKAELKDALRPLWERGLEEHNSRPNLIALAQAVVDELMGE